MPKNKPSKKVNFEAEQLYFLSIILLYFLAILSYNYSHLFGYLLMTIGLLATLYMGVKGRNDIRMTPLVYASYMALILSFAYIQAMTQQSYGNFLSLMWYVNTSIIVVCGIIFAFGNSKKTNQIKVLGDDAPTTLFRAILFAFLSMGAVYFTSFQYFVVIGVFASNYAIFLLFTSIALIIYRK